MPTTQVVNFPVGLLWFSFVASVALVLLTIGRYAIEFSRSATLDLRLTRECFFRVIDGGDTLFANAVLLARNGPVLIEAASMTLKKLDGAVKTYPLQIQQFGEKARGQGVIAEFYFKTTSPKSFVAASHTDRVVYVCAHQDYSTRCLTLVNEFRDWVWQYKASLEGTNLATVDMQTALSIAQPVRERARALAAEVMELVQLEMGQYRLTLSVQYRRPGSLLNGSKSVESAIEFAIRSDVRVRIRNQLPTLFEGIASAILLNNDQKLTFPEVNPEDSREI